MSHAESSQQSCFAFAAFAVLYQKIERSLVSKLPMRRSIFDIAWLIARKKSTIPKAPVSSKMVLAVDRQGFEPWTP